MTSIVNRISEMILGSPLAVKVERELAAETLAQRQQLADELAALDQAELVAVHETHDPARAHALAEFRRCEAALDAARAQLAGVHQAATVASFETERKRELLRRALASSASPSIAATERALRADLDATYSARDEVVGRNLDRRQLVVWSNQASVTQRIAAIMAAIATVQGLFYSALDSEALEARLAEVHAGLPPLEARPAKYSGIPELARA